MAVFEFRHVGKIYGHDIHAVDDLSLVISDGEFTVVVGPSGCGKSTILRLVAGLEDISRGEIRVDGQIINQIPPQKREVAMVFQSYALYPHLSVYDNMAFPLKVRKHDKNSIDTRVKAVAEILGLSTLLKRMPRELSGGQKQRVALGRAMVREPKVFLFDEPLSNLDAALRAEMRVEIAELHRRLKTNFIYVTHDQVEAVTLGQKIVVLKAGQLQQYAAPDEVFRRPANMFVAGFIGTPPMNFLSMDLGRTGGRFMARSDTWQIPLPPSFAPCLEGYGKQKIMVGIRPKDLSLGIRADSAETDDHCTLQAKFLLKESIGDDILYYFDLAREAGAGRPFIMKETRSFALNRQETVQIFLNTKEIYLFDPDSGTTLVE